MLQLSIAHPVGLRPETPRWMRRKRGAGICVPECSHAALIRWIDYPELPLKTSACETVKCGRSSMVVRAEIPCGAGRLPIAYKRFRRRNLWKVVARAFKPSRAGRAWKRGCRLLERGIATPRPVFAVVPGGPLRRIDSYLATEWVEGHSLAVLLHQATISGSWQDLPPVLTAVSRLLGRLHREGFSHRDLKPGNILISRGTGHVLLVDLDGVTCGRTVSRRVRLRNLSRLFRGASGEFAVTSPLGTAFVQQYLQASGDNGWSWRDCRQQLALATESRSPGQRSAQRRAA